MLFNILVGLTCTKYIMHIDLVCRYLSDFLDFVVENSKFGVSIYNHSVPKLHYVLFSVRRGQ